MHTDLKRENIIIFATHTHNGGPKIGHRYDADIFPRLFGTTAYEGFYMSALMIPDAGYIWADTLIEASKEI